MKNKCSVCTKGFEPKRSDAKYCSNACKQKAHTLRKKSLAQAVGPEQAFYLDEYLSVRDFYGIKAEDMPLMFYCFLRINLPQNAKKENIIKYIDSVWASETYEELKGTNAYKSFKERFLSCAYKIWESRD